MVTMATPVRRRKKKAAKTTLLNNNNSNVIIDRVALIVFLLLVALRVLVLRIEYQMVQVQEEQSSSEEEVISHLIPKFLRRRHRNSGVGSYDWPSLYQKTTLSDSNSNNAATNGNGQHPPAAAAAAASAAVVYYTSPYYDNPILKDAEQDFDDNGILRHENSSSFHGPGTMWITELSVNNFTPGVVARPFRAWDYETYPKLPCYQPEIKWTESNRQEYLSTWYQNFDFMNEGFMFMRPLKTGSTSSIGMILRMLTNVAKRDGIMQKGSRRGKRKWRRPKHDDDDMMCKVRFTHGFGQPSFAQRFRNRKVGGGKSFLFTILRDPTKRSISQYYFMDVSKEIKSPTDRDFHHYLRTYPQMLDYYLKVLPTKGYYNGREDDDESDVTNEHAIQTANNIIQEYDFIGITERFDESAVALAMLLDVPLGDILYMSVKQSGKGFDLAFKRCMYVFKPYVSPTMQQYFMSNAWKNRIVYDAALYRAANRSLDLTIDQVLGRSKFETKLRTYQNALQVANKRCAHKTIHRCTEGGDIVTSDDNDCLWDNAACGMSCLDEVANDLNLY